jgi:rod shape-determining protein MreD
VAGRRVLPPTQSGVALMAHIDRRPGIRPRPTFGRRLDIIARTCFPGCMTILLMLLTQMPIGIYGQAELLPAVTMAAVWFWSLARPDTMPPPLVFVIGLMVDLMGYMPLGVTAFTMLAIHGIAISMRRPLAARGFAVIWLVYSLVALTASVLMWLLVMLLNFHLFPPNAVLFQSVLAVAIYPVIAIPFSAAHHSVANTDNV